MAFTDKTRIGSYHQKKHNCQAVVQVSSEEFKEFNAAGNYLVVNLPPLAVVTNAYVHTLVASDAGAVALGTTEGGTEIMSAGDSTTLGESGTFTGQVATGTGTPLYMSLAAAATEGNFLVVVDYLEFTKNTGEYTKINK
jgi:hypothetical protein